MMRLAAWAAALGAALAWAGGKYTDEQLAARDYEDLGQAQVSLKGYPSDMQTKYAVFTRVCSQCHTLARPLNAPLVKRRDWDRYVRRMHLHTRVEPLTEITAGEAKDILDFLVYDSKVRKVQHKKDFDAETERLKKLFEDVKAERGRRQIEEDQKKARPMPADTGTGVNPQTDTGPGSPVKMPGRN